MIIMITHSTSAFLPHFIVLHSESSINREVEKEAKL
jgi:hypothetical protein